MTDSSGSDASYSDAGGSSEDSRDSNEEPNALSCFDSSDEELPVRATRSQTRNQSPQKKQSPKRKQSPRKKQSPKKSQKKQSSPAKRTRSQTNSPKKAKSKKQKSSEEPKRTRSQIKKKTNKKNNDEEEQPATPKQTDDDEAEEPTAAEQTDDDKAEEPTAAKQTDDDEAEEPTAAKQTDDSAKRLGKQWHGPTTPFGRGNKVALGKEKKTLSYDECWQFYRPRGILRVGGWGASNYSAGKITSLTTVRRGRNATKFPKNPDNKRAQILCCENLVPITIEPDVLQPCPMKQQFLRDIRDDLWYRVVIREKAGVVVAPVHEKETNTDTSGMWHACEQTPAINCVHANINLHM